MDEWADLYIEIISKCILGFTNLNNAFKPWVGFSQIRKQLLVFLYFVILSELLYEHFK